MRRLLVLIPLALVFFGSSANSTPAVQHYKVGTSADDGWQAGVAPKGNTAISSPPSGGSCENYYDGSTYSFMVLSSAYRFENVQLDQGAVVTDVRLNLELTNNQYGGIVTEFRSPIGIQLSGDSNDFVYQKNIVDRPRTALATWDTFPADASLGHVAYTQSPNLAAQVNQVLALPGWHRGNSITVLVIGEVYAAGSEEETEYAHAYGWTAKAWDCHALPPTLDIS